MTTEMQRQAEEPGRAAEVSAELTPVAHDVFPDLAVSLDEVERRVRLLQDFVRSQMTEGEDYGTIPGTAKPTLFKPGAEKLNAIFGLAPMVQITNRVEDWDSGFVSYETKVTLLNKRTNQVEAEGLGSCNSRERRYRNQDAANIANTILKMSKKRALVDATLSATRASGLFTQDLEDLDADLFNGDSRGRGSYAGTPRQAGHGSTNGSHRSAAEPSPAPRAAAEPVQERRPARPAAEPGFADGKLTEAQHRAIIVIVHKVFGRPPKPEDWSEVADRPVEQLSKSEASALIDRLRSRLNEQQAQAGRAEPAQSGYRRSALTR